MPGSRELVKIDVAVNTAADIGDERVVTELVAPPLARRHGIVDLQLGIADAKAA